MEGELICTIHHDIIASCSGIDGKFNKMTKITSFYWFTFKKKIVVKLHSGLVTKLKVHVGKFSTYHSDVLMSRIVVSTTGQL